MLLQCNSEYPTKLEEQGHNLIIDLKKYNVLTGTSDHTGNLNYLLHQFIASIIETHVIDKDYFGPDTSSSITFSLIS